MRLLAGHAADPRLAGLATPERLGAAWIDDNDAIIAASGTVENESRLTSPASASFPAPVDPYTAVALATNGTTMISASAIGGTTVLHLIDASTRQMVAMDQTSPTMVENAHAIAATGATTGTQYVFTGIDSGGNINVWGVDGANTITGGVMHGFMDSYAGLAVMNGEIVLVVVSTDSASCEIDSIAVDFQSTGALVAFGGATCAQPIMAQGPGRTDFLLLTYDTGTTSILQRIATHTGNMITLGTASDFAPGSEPRATATSSGYWTTYHVSGHIRAKHLTFAGVEDSDFLVTKVVDDTSYDVVTRNDEAYVVWLDDVLYVQRLCVN